MLVDTHLHLYHERYDEDRDAMLDRAREAGVRTFFLPAIDVASIYAALDLAHRHPDVYVMAGIHPSETQHTPETALAEVETLARDVRVVGIGESGLDHYWDRSFDDRQEVFFRAHIRLAAEVGKPLILHNRDATERLLEVLHEERLRLPDPARLRGILHCFSDEASVLLRPEAEGFLAGLGGNVTYKKSRTADTLADFPLNRVVLETDGPYLAPVPHRGKRNEPAYIPLIARLIADRLALPYETIATQTTQNAGNLFGIEFM